MTEAGFCFNFVTNVHGAEVQNKLSVKLIKKNEDVEAMQPRNPGSVTDFFFSFCEEFCTLC